MSFDKTTTGDEVVKAFGAQVKGKTVVVTGPSENGIGAQTAIFLAAGKPKVIVLAGRDEVKIQPVIEEIKKTHRDVRVTFVQLDLANQRSVREAAKDIDRQVEKVDILINNAGVMAIKTYTTTSDGIETQFGANHIGHFLLTKQLMPKMLAAGSGARIINLSSNGYLAGGVRFDDHNFNNGEDYNPWTAYSQSKTANILFSAYLAKKLRSKGIQAFAVNPGLIMETKLMVNVDEKMFGEGYAITQKAINGAPMPDITPKSLAAGTSTTIYAALDPGLAVHSGAFLSDCALHGDHMQPHALGEDNQEKLWALSEKLIGEKFSL